MKKKVINNIKELAKTVIDNDFFGMASEMSFMMVLGLFPFMLFLMAVFGWAGNKAFMNSVLIAMSRFMPEQAMNLVLTVLDEVMIFSKGGIMFVVAICVTLFLSLNAVAMVLKGLNRAYKVEETRSFLYTRTLSLVMVFVNIFILFLNINLIVFGKVIIGFSEKYLGMSHGIGLTLLTLRWPVAFLTLYLLAFLSYYILPDLKCPEILRRKSALPGTIFFSTFWLVGSWGFSIYVNNLRTYNFVYGTIGAFAVLMIWLYYTSLLILLGGEINSRVYNKLDKR